MTFIITIVVGAIIVAVFIIIAIIKFNAIIISIVIIIISFTAIIIISFANDSIIDAVNAFIFVKFVVVVDEAVFVIVASLMT